MPQTGQIREPQPRPVRAHFRPGSGGGAQIAVGKGKENKIGRFVAEIDRRLILVERSGFANEQMH
jgi:hypothetical protein